MPKTAPDASTGGKARAAALSPERRAEIARTAAQKRWGGGGAEPPAAAKAVAAGIVEAKPAAFRRIAAGQIFASPLNPRQTAPDPEAELHLALSVAQKGVLQPILVRPARQTGIDGERFEIIMGSRRHRAAARALAGVDDDSGTVWRLPADYLLPCLVRECSDDDLVILAGVENFDREAMVPLDEAALFARLRPRVTPRAKPDGTMQTRVQNCLVHVPPHPRRSRQRRFPQAHGHCRG